MSMDWAAWEVELQCLIDDVFNVTESTERESPSSSSSTSSSVDAKHQAMLDEEAMLEDEAMLDEQATHAGQASPSLEFALFWTVTDLFFAERSCAQKRQLYVQLHSEWRSIRKQFFN